MKLFEKSKCGRQRTIKICGLPLFTYKRAEKTGGRFPHCQVDSQTAIDDNSKIGEYTFIGKDVDITKTKVGRYCSIAPHVSIGMGEHDMSEISTSRFLSDQQNYTHLTQKPCEIRDDVWIGTRSVIRRGVTVGIGAVVGANSFVNRDVPDFAIVAGSPARLIRYRFDESLRRKILQSRYWTFDPEAARKKIRELTDA